VVIHTRDHKPTHVHVVGPNAEAKFNLGSWEVMDNRGFEQKTLNRILDYLKPREKEFLEAWNAIHEIEED
jgi:hypothetical protein